MGMTRRQFVLAGLAALATGCAANPTAVTGTRPRPAWPGGPEPAPTTRPRVTPPPPTAAPTPTPPPPTTAVGPLRAIPRSSWAEQNPLGHRLRLMRAIRRITVHHEGSTPVWFTDAPSTAGRLESIRRAHLDRLTAGDIGYHFVIDRAGRLWQGRSLRYQGAHVKHHNPYNLGIMCLGNFDLQRPSDDQLATLNRALPQLMRRYRVPANRVHTHQELMPTRCPGRSLQDHMARLRVTGHLA